MLLGSIKEPLPTVVTRIGGGPYGGDKPGTKGTGQAKACPARPTIESDSSALTCLLITFGAAAPLLHELSRSVVGFTTTDAV